MTITYAKPSEVPTYVDTLFDADGVRFDRDTESLAEVWNCGDAYGIPVEAVFESFAPLTLACVRCESKPAESICCSSHQKELCHGCYRRTHFVEICGAPVDGERKCPKCEAEGLDPNARVR